MTSAIYPTYTRIINVYRQSAVDGSLTLAEDIGVGGNISIAVESASFTLCAERGCAEGEIIALSATATSLLVRRMNPFVLEHGDVIAMIPEAGADPWYLGYIRQRSRDFTGRLIYSLYGLAGKLTDLPVCSSTAPNYFGTAVDLSFWPGDSVYFPSHPSAGLVQWLMSDSVQDGDGNFVTGPVVAAKTGILAPDSWNAECAGMSTAEEDKIEILCLDQEAKVATVLEEQSRSISDPIVGNTANPRPVLWGVGPDQKLYFRFRPESELMALDLVRGRQAPLLTIGGTSVIWTGGQITEEEGEDFRNVLFLRGGADDSIYGAGRTGAGNTQVLGTYTNAASIANYKQRRSDTQEIASIRTPADADRFAAAYFQRYATIQNSYNIPGAAIPAATKLPLPWAGYAQITSDTITGLAGKHTINSVAVEFNETPLATIQLCSSTPGVFGSSGTGVRWPGNSYKASFDRIPRVNTAQGGGGGETLLIADDSLSWTYWGGWT